MKIKLTEIFITVLFLLQIHVPLLFKILMKSTTYNSVQYFFYFCNLPQIYLLTVKEMEPNFMDLGYSSSAAMDVHPEA